MKAHLLPNLVSTKTIEEILWNQVLVSDKVLGIRIVLLRHLLIERDEGLGKDIVNSSRTRSFTMLHC